MKLLPFQDHDVYLNQGTEVTGLSHGHGDGLGGGDGEGVKDCLYTSFDTTGCGPGAPYQYGPGCYGGGCGPGTGYRQNGSGASALALFYAIRRVTP